MSGQFPWYVARSAGLVAWALLAASVLWGLALSTKILTGAIPPGAHDSRWARPLAPPATGLRRAPSRSRAW